MSIRAPSESAVLRAVLDLLAWRGVLAWRSNQIPAPLPGGKGFRRFVGMPGCSDIIAVVPTWANVATRDNCWSSVTQIGRFAGIEVKRVGGKQSPAQREFQRRVEAAGGVYAVVSDAKELERLLDGWGV